MTTWGLKNGRGFHLETPEGTRFLMDKNGVIKQVKPEFDIIKSKGRTELKVSGDPD